ncbi:MAG: TRAP transporter TatT component family protein [Deltaproteobacteria bacterium]|nr:TRAP transporter TatT component family protein [Deltaproteobacteria bacterium]
MTASLRVVLLFVLAAAAGCIRQFVVDSAADALVGGGMGGSLFASDDDPELVAEALPFGLKVMEALHREAPEHRGLCVALAAGFTQYAQGFVAPRATDAELKVANAIELRTKKLHLRGHRYGLQALELAHPGFIKKWETDPATAVAALGRDEVDAIYWTGAPLAAAIAISASDMRLVAELPKAEALMKRALELDPDWNEGALHEFFISYEGRSDALGGSPQRAREHFERARDLTRGQKASVFVAFCEAVAIKQQDRPLFDRLIERALAIDPDAEPRYRLANLIAQERARWLRDHVDGLIL